MAVFVNVQATAAPSLTKSILQKKINVFPSGYVFVLSLEPDLKCLTSFSYYAVYCICTAFVSCTF